MPVPQKSLSLPSISPSSNPVKDSHSLVDESQNTNSHSDAAAQAVAVDGMRETRGAESEEISTTIAIAPPSPPLPSSPSSPRPETATMASEVVQGGSTSTSTSPGGDVEGELTTAPASATSAVEIQAQANDEDTAVDDSIVEALRTPKDRMFVLMVGDKMESLINERNPKTKIELTAPSTYQRLLVHRCAAYYKLTAETEPPTKIISVSISAESRIPLRRVADLVPAEVAPPPAFQIMRRINQEKYRNRGSGASSATGGDDNNTNSAPGTTADPSSDVELSEAGSSRSGSKPKKHMTISEREAAYKEARSRIFMDFKEKERASVTATSGSQPASASASSSNLSIVSSGGGGSSVGDVDDSGSTAPTESEWSAPAVKHHHRPQNRERMTGKKGHQHRDHVRDASRNTRLGQGHAIQSYSPLGSDEYGDGFNYPTLYDPNTDSMVPPPLPPPAGSAPPPPLPPPPQNPYGTVYPVYSYPQTSSYYYPYPYPPPANPPLQQSQPHEPSPNLNTGPPTPYEGYAPPPTGYVPYMWPPPPPPPHQPVQAHHEQQPQHHIMGGDSSHGGSFAQSPGGYGASYPMYSSGYYHTTQYAPPEYPPPQPPPTLDVYETHHNTHDMQAHHEPQNPNNRPGPGPNGRRGSQNQRTSWSYGPGASLGGFPALNGHSDAMGPRMSRRGGAPPFQHQSNSSSSSSHGHNHGGQRTPGDEAASVASTSSSSSSRQTIASSSTTSKHPLPARPDWAVGMKPSSHRPQNGSLPGLARHSPRRTPNQQLSPMSLQPGDFPPLTIHNVNANGHGNNGPLNAEKRLPTASNVWNNQDSTRAVLTMGNAPPLPPNHHPYGQHPPGPLPPPHLQHPQYQPQHYPPPPDHQLMNGNPNARPQGYLSHPPPPVPLQTQGYGHPSHPSPHAHAPPPPPPPHQHQYQQHQQQPQAAPFQGRPTRLDEYDARFERPPPKGGTGLYNPKAGNNGSNQSINQQVHVQQRTVNPNANASSSVQSPSQPQPQPHPGPPAHPQHQHHAHSYTNGVGRAGANEKIAENARESVQRELERVRSESVASAILVNGVGGMSINEGMPGAAGVEGGADRS